MFGAVLRLCDRYCSGFMVPNHHKNRESNADNALRNVLETSQLRTRFCVGLPQENSAKIETCGPNRMKCEKIEVVSILALWYLKLFNSF